MCLATVDKKTKCKDGKGWKVFSFKDGIGPRAYILEYRKAHAHPTNCWINDESPAVENIQIFGRGYYPIGFHVSTNKKDAQSLCNLVPDEDRILCVYYRDVVASGRQHGGNVVVARQIYIED